MRGLLLALEGLPALHHDQWLQPRQRNELPGDRCRRLDHHQHVQSSLGQSRELVPGAKRELRLPGAVERHRDQADLA